MNIAEKNLAKLLQVAAGAAQPDHLQPQPDRAGWRWRRSLTSDIVRELIPALKAAGAEGIIEYPAEQSGVLKRRGLWRRLSARRLRRPGPEALRRHGMCGRCGFHIEAHGAQGTARRAFSSRPISVQELGLVRALARVRGVVSGVGTGATRLVGGWVQALDAGAGEGAGAGVGWCGCGRRCGCRCGADCCGSWCGCGCRGRVFGNDIEFEAVQVGAVGLQRSGRRIPNRGKLGDLQQEWIPAGL